MTELPPLLRDQRKTDADHLRLLSIFHYVGAGLAALGLVFLVFHYLIFHAFFSNPDMWKGQRGSTPPPKELLAMFKWFYVFFGLWLVSSGILNILSGRFIGQRKFRTFSIVIAVMNCIHIPLGTVLGVFTIIVLLRPSVQEAYEASQSSFPTPSPGAPPAGQEPRLP